MNPLTGVAMFGFRTDMTVDSLFTFGFSLMVVSSTFASAPFTMLFSSGVPSGFTVTLVSLVFPLVTMVLWFSVGSVIILFLDLIAPAPAKSGVVKMLILSTISRLVFVTLV